MTDIESLKIIQSRQLENNKVPAASIKVSGRDVKANRPKSTGPKEKKAAKDPNTKQLMKNRNETKHITTHTSKPFIHAETEPRILESSKKDIEDGLEFPKFSNAVGDLQFRRETERIAPRVFH